MPAPINGNGNGNGNGHGAGGLGGVNGNSQNAGGVSGNPNAGGTTGTGGTSGTGGTGATSGTGGATIVNINFDAYASFDKYSEGKYEGNNAEFYSNSGYAVGFDLINDSVTDDSMMTMLSMFMNPEAPVATPTSDNMFTVLADEMAESNSILEGYQMIYDPEPPVTTETGLADMIGSTVSTGGNSRSLTEKTESAMLAYDNNDLAVETDNILNEQV